MDENQHISDDEIRKDIEDTREEIRTMYRQEHAMMMLGDRISRMKANALVHGIKERKEFIKQLKNILCKRSENNHEK